jgi:hypothetical protein
MGTATATAAPTEAEIREAILTELGARTIDPDDFAGLADTFAPIMDSDAALTRAGWVDNFYPAADHPGTLWADLTADETAELHGAMAAVRDHVLREATRALVDGCAAAAFAFGQAHPDIPRGRYPLHSAAARVLEPVG